MRLNILNTSRNWSVNKKIIGIFNPHIHISIWKDTLFPLIEIEILIDNYNISS